MNLRIGSRGSDLALAQSRMIRGLLAELPETGEVEIEIIKTSGDLVQNVSLAELAGTSDERKGLFTKEIEDALLENKVDLAVHSYKDLPTQMVPGLVIAAMPRRVADHDLLVYPRKNRGRDSLPYLKRGARVGTSAVRRIAQLAFRFPDLKCETIRGNVPTRLRKLHEGQFDAIILAAAGVERLKAAGTFSEGEHAGLLDGLEMTPLQPPDFIPAPAQGALAVQCRESDADLIALLQRLHDDAAAHGVDAERSLLAALEGGCHLPLGASCRRRTSGEYDLHVFLGDEAEDNRRGGSYVIRRFGDDAEWLAERVQIEIKSPLPIVLTGRADRLAEVERELASEAGAADRLIPLPLIEIERLGIESEHRQAYHDWFELQKADPVPALIAVFSAPGADAFAAFVQSEKVTLPLDIRWAVNGERTAARLLELFPEANIAFESRDGTGGTLASQLIQAGISSALAVSAERSRPEFAEVLRQAGGEVQRLLLYRTSSKPPAPEALRALPEEALIIFGSPSGVETFLPAMEAAGRSEAGLRFCALGPTTARSLEAAGRRPYALAARTDYTDFVRDLL